MSKISRGMWSASLVVLALGACSSNKATVDAKTADAAPAGLESVSCTGITPAAMVTSNTPGTMVFTPAATTITMGQTVEFISGASHNVVGTSSNAAALQGGLGSTVCFQFVATGTFNFKCSIHGFTGSVTVQ